MRQLQDVARERDDMTTIVDLTSAFESLASMHIARIKNQVQQSEKFFDELWHIYRQIRVDSMFRFGREEHRSVIDKELFIAITAEGGFSGDIDQKLIDWMLKDYDADKQDIIVIGHHGAVQLAQNGVRFKKYFKLPAQDQNINVTPLVKHVRDYRNTTVYYQAYVSLMVQEVKKIELSVAVQEAGQQTGATDEAGKEDIISEHNYIFEPSTFAVIAHLERSMLDITLSQVILDSKLAQYASRFRSMTSARELATDSQQTLRLSYNRLKRAISDERLKEIVNGMKAAGV